MENACKTSITRGYLFTSVKSAKEKDSFIWEPNVQRKRIAASHSNPSSSGKLKSGGECSTIFISGFLVINHHENDTIFKITTRHSISKSRRGQFYVLVLFFFFTHSTMAQT